MPELNGFGYLLDYFIELGAVSSAHEGIQALSFTEIKAWCELMNTKLRPWEVKIIRKMSSAYVGMDYKARKPETQAPHMSQKDAEAITKAGLESFKRMARK